MISLYSLFAETTLSLCHENIHVTSECRIVIDAVIIVIAIQCNTNLVHTQIMTVINLAGMATSIQHYRRIERACCACPLR